MLNTTKTSGRKIVRLDPQRCAELLVAALPVQLETAQQHQRMLAVLRRLIRKGDDLAAEEAVLLKVLAQLVEEYERRIYQPEKPTPLEVLVELLAARDLKQADLLPVLKSKSVIAEIVSGKRAISKANAKALAEFFHVPAEVFL